MDNNTHRNMLNIKVSFCAIIFCLIGMAHPKSLQAQTVFQVINTADKHTRQTLLKHQRHPGCIYLDVGRQEIPVLVSGYFRRSPISKGFHGAFFNYSINFLRPPNPPSSQYHPLQELGSFDRFQLGFVVIQESCFCPLLEILGPLRNIQPFNLIGVLSLAF